MAPLELDCFDDEQPWRYYFSWEDQLKTADHWLLVEGVELPVHAAILANMSPVFQNAAEIPELGTPAKKRKMSTEASEQVCGSAVVMFFFQGALLPGQA
jgi:hypothetical protein